tara:strand:- start:142 stop:636 length:495 start_codon:yes stop_codon:yes gene_type:complete
VEIEDNYLPTKSLKFILDTMSGENFPWYYQSFKERSSDKDVLLTHLFYNNYPLLSNEWVTMLNPIIEKINPDALIRIKANSYPCTHTVREHKMHIDSPFKCTTSIFYLNTNNGVTKFINGEVVSSVANRLVTFPTQLEHASSSCSDERVRYNINFNYFGNEICS